VISVGNKKHIGPYSGKHISVLNIWTFLALYQRVTLGLHNLRYPYAAARDLHPKSCPCTRAGFIIIIIIIVVVVVVVVDLVNGRSFDTITHHLIIPTLNTLELLAHPLSTICV
jgi:hypothetical protein